MRKLALLTTMFCMAVMVQAQDNIVKLGLGSAAQGGINLEYERVLTEKTTVLVELNFKVPSSIPGTAFDQVENQGTTNNLQFTSGDVKGFMFAGEYRFYTKGNAPQGFYLAPYLKLNNNQLDLTGTYSNNITGATNIAAAAGLGLFTASVGGNIGYQWLIADKVAINWNILGLGLGVNRISGDFTADDNGVFNDFRQDVETFIEYFPGLRNALLTSDNTARTIDAAGGFIFPTARVSVSIGYAF